MSSLNIRIPEKVRAAAEARAAQGNSTLDEYVESLIIADATDDFCAPEHLKVGSQAQLLALLPEGEASPAREMTTSDWDAMRQRLIAHHTTSKAG